MEDRIYSFIGLATKAGKTASGETGTDKAIKKGEAHLVLIANDASQNTKKAVLNSCKFYQIPVMVWGMKEKLGKFCGKENRSSVAILDQGFADQLIKKIDNSVMKDGGVSYGEA